MQIVLQGSFPHFPPSPDAHHNHKGIGTNIPRWGYRFGFGRWFVAAALVAGLWVASGDFIGTPSLAMGLSSGAGGPAPGSCLYFGEGSGDGSGLTASWLCQPTAGVPVTFAAPSISNGILPYLMGDIPEAVMGRDYWWPGSLEEHLVLYYGDRTWQVALAELTGLVGPVERWGPSGPWLITALDRVKLTAVVQGLAGEIDRPPLDATLSLVDGTPVVAPAAYGFTLDAEGTVDDIEAHLAAGQRRVPLRVLVSRPNVFSADLLPLRTVIQKVVSGLLTLEHRGRTFVLDQASLARALLYDGKGGRDGKILRLDPKAMADYLDKVAQAVYVPPRNARFRLVENQVQAVADAVPGQTLNVEATLAAAMVALLRGERVVPIVVDLLPPAFLESDTDKVVIGGDLLMEASTSYAGSILARAQNVELATLRLDGIIVEPGGIFSFNEALGPTDQVNGFDVAYGIIISGTTPLTVRSVAGGICQVATTVFQVAFWAGFPILERWPHLYWIPRYGQPPRGMPGLDATVDADYKVDFRFKNDTDYWIVLRSQLARGNVSFAIYGTATGWKVEIELSQVTNVVKADPTEVRQEDPNLPVGTALLVEHAEDGFDVTIVRTVTTEDGKLLHRQKFRSRYLPSRNVVLVGTQEPAAAENSPEVKQASQ